MKALITGIQGFVGQHLAAELAGSGYDVRGIDLIEGKDTAKVDLLDPDAVRRHIDSVRPDVLFHLAAQANVALSWKQPQKTFEINLIGTINLLEAIRAAGAPCRLILVGSSDQYGVTGAAVPIAETTPLNPRNPYAASKKAQEEIARVYAEAHSLDVCLTRSFNHSGPGQKPGFLIPDICCGIVKIERGESERLKVGNMEAVRDFTDVRDIARAYRLIGEKGASGEAYNVGSGTGRKAQDILGALTRMSKCDIVVQPDPERMRVSDTPVFVCDNTKLRQHTGWAPAIPFEQTLEDTLEYYRENAK